MSDEEILAKSRTARRTGLAIAAAAALLAAVGSAAARQPMGGASPAFSCDVNSRVCTCQGVYDGADCRAMRQNCEGWDPKTGTGTVILECAGGTCTCKMARLRRPDSAQPPNIAPGTIAPSTER